MWLARSYWKTPGNTGIGGEKVPTKLTIGMSGCTYSLLLETDDVIEYKQVLEVLRKFVEHKENLIVKTKEETIAEICYVIVNHGQNDKRFKLGETIKYSPSEIEKILKEDWDV